jgi:dihydrofolate reductase
VRVSGGADTIAQYLNAGVVDEMLIQLAPIVLGGGVRLFDRVDASRVSFEIAETVTSRLVTHIRYKITPKSH